MRAAAGEFTFGSLRSNSPRMGRIFGLLEDLARSDASVLFWGESGTGKTELALALHEASKLRRRAMLRCTGLSASELKEALVGNGSPLRPQGAIRESRDGSLILLDIAALTAADQDLALACVGGRAIIGRQIRSIAGSRVISTCRQDLDRLVRFGHFREDLYYRLATVTVHVPTLRERREDILVLADLFLDVEAAKKSKGPAAVLTPDAREFMLGYPWPGNVRQLNAVLSLAASRARGQAITHHALAELMKPVESAPDIRIPLGVSLAHAERVVIRETLASNGGNRQTTADVLNISRRTLYEKLRHYRSDGFAADEFKEQRGRRPKKNGEPPEGPPASP